MGVIIRMNSKELVQDFLGEFNNRKFNFLLVSHDIKTNGSRKNVYSLNRLIPPPNVTSIYVNKGMCDKYVNAYLEYIQGKQASALIAAMVKLAVVDDTNVVILCSEREAEYNYTKIICQYIESLYGVKTYSYKKFSKDPKGCKSKPKNKDKFLKKLKAKMENFDPEKISSSVDVDGLKNKLKGWSRKELIHFCDDNHIKYDDDFSKKELIKKIIKKVTK